MKYSHKTHPDRHLFDANDRNVILVPSLFPKPRNPPLVNLKAFASTTLVD